MATSLFLCSVSLTAASAASVCALNDRSVNLLISNDAPTSPPSTPSPLHGHGLTGMRERARLLDGALNAGPDPDRGGWRVYADLPWNLA